MAERLAVEILSVSTEPIDDGRLRAGALVPPGRGSAYDGTYSFPIEGWAIPNAPGKLEFEIRSHGQVLKAARAQGPDVVDQDASETEPSRFQVVVSSLSMPVEFELDVVAVAEDGSSTRLGSIRGRRPRLRSTYTPVLQPLLLTTIGRSGSFWLAAVLAACRRVISRNVGFEPKLTSYWMDVLGALAEPASYWQAIRPQISGPDWWLGARQTPLPLEVESREMPQWLGGENIEAFAGFCQSRFDAFYQMLARTEGRPEVSHFVEKSYPGVTPRLIAELYPDGREIVLVRDFRDMICSIDDYNAKRGFRLWGRDRAETDEQWFGHLRGEATKLLEGWRERDRRAHLIRYEQLIEDPLTTLAAVLAYVGINVSSEAIERMLALAGELAPHAQSFHRTSTSAERSVGRWRRDLSPARQALCAEYFDDLLVAFGYERTAEAATVPPLYSSQT